MAAQKIHGHDPGRYLDGRGTRPECSVSEWSGPHEDVDHVARRGATRVRTGGPADPDVRPAARHDPDHGRADREIGRAQRVAGPETARPHAADHGGPERAALESGAPRPRESLTRRLSRD